MVVEGAVSGEALEALAGLFDGRERVLVLTGAGCSTGSGIPDYRGADGSWKHPRPMTFAEFAGSPAARRRYWAGSVRGWPRVRDARPSGAHRALARLQALGRVGRVVTQNVDGLHQRAGSARVLDLHGRLDLVECLACGARMGREDVQALLVAWNPRLAASSGRVEPRPDGDAAVAGTLEGLAVPDCRECGGVLKPAVVFFGENVPRARVTEAMAEVERADALLVVGSSLMVYSGYRFVLAARARGLSVVLLNVGRTRADAAADLKVEADCATALEAVAGLLDGRAAAG